MTETVAYQQATCVVYLLRELMCASLMNCQTKREIYFLHSEKFLKHQVQSWVDIEIMLATLRRTVSYLLSCPPVVSKFNATNNEIACSCYRCIVLHPLAPHSTLRNIFPFYTSGVAGPIMGVGWGDIHVIMFCCIMFNFFQQLLHEHMGSAPPPTISIIEGGGAVFIYSSSFVLCSIVFSRL